ncbi:hypothetical protein [Demequina aurantiaca]|uniref:hypothetical protein n=1 Tax=Demequina aurantiaca TaxID=676200 RepID=UPI003D3366D1
MTRFRARSSIVYSSIVMGMCALISLVVLIGGGWYQARPVFGIMAIFAALAYAAYFRPSVDVYEDRAELVNVLTTATVPFSRLASISTRWALELHADDASKSSAFAAPAPGAMKSRSVKKSEAEWDPEIATLIYSDGPGTSTATSSGVAAHLVDDAYQAWKKATTTHATPADASAAGGDHSAVASANDNLQAPQTATASGKAITRRPNWLSIAVLTAGLALLVLSL